MFWICIIMFCLNIFSFFVIQTDTQLVNAALCIFAALIFYYIEGYEL